MSDEVEIRVARPDEFEAVGLLTVAAYSSLPGFDDPVDYASALMDVAGRARHADILVAVAVSVATGEPGTRLLGAVTYVEDSDSEMSEWDDVEAAGIRMLAVSPEAHGCGVGRRLTDVCLEKARAAGKKTMLLHSTEFMHAAHALYKSIGFERCEAIDFSVGPVDLMGFRLAL